MTTISEFVANLAAVGSSVASVNTVLTTPPTNVQRPDLPASFPMFPDGTNDAIDTCNDITNITCQLIIAAQSIAQGEQDVNYQLTIDIASELNSALRTAVLGNINQTEFNIQTVAGQPGTAPLSIAGVQYWGVVATVTAVLEE